MKSNKYLTIGIIMSPILGYLIHELGHFIFGIYNGFDVEFHHNFVKPKNHLIYNKILNHKDSINTIDFKSLNLELKNNTLLFYLGGPIFTYIFSIIGLIIIYLIPFKGNLKINHIVGISISLMIFRQLIIPFLNIFNLNLFNDEKQIAFFLNIDVEYFNLMLILISLIPIVILFRYFDKKTMRQIVFKSIVFIPTTILLWNLFGKYLFQ